VQTQGDAAQHTVASPDNEIDATSAHTAQQPSEEIRERRENNEVQSSNEQKKLQKKSKKSSRRNGKISGSLEVETLAETAQLGEHETSESQASVTPHAASSSSERNTDHKTDHSEDSESPQTHTALSDELKSEIRTMVNQLLTPLERNYQALLGKVDRLQERLNGLEPLLLLAPTVNSERRHGIVLSPERELAR
jgi:hypothetical protein